MIRQHILKFLNEIESDESLEAFHVFLIGLKNAHHTSKDELYDILMDILQKEGHEDNFIYNQIAGTLDYFVGWHSPLKESDSTSVFVQQLNS